MRSFYSFKFRKGFTLIEVLVIIAIIGILTTFAAANLISGRTKSRDAKRKSDLRQIQAAFEAYRGTENAYPVLPSLPACNTNAGIIGLAPNNTSYISNIPCDPSGTSYWNSGNYGYVGTTSSYELWACIENGDDIDNNITSSTPTSPLPSGGCNTSGGAKWYRLVNQ